MRLKYCHIFFRLLMLDVQAMMVHDLLSVIILLYGLAVSYVADIMTR